MVISRETHQYIELHEVQLFWASFASEIAIETENWQPTSKQPRIGLNVSWESKWKLLRVEAFNFLKTLMKLYLPTFEAGKYVK